MSRSLPSRRHQPPPKRRSLAGVAELADAHGSGPCTRKGVGVRVPSSAPRFLFSSFSIASVEERSCRRVAELNLQYTTQRPEPCPMRTTRVQTQCGTCNDVYA